ncbi:MAG: hypothetical protein MUQ65_17180 [Armatimonadetes bacterium]|nr:hypothetical protein [Armatimonadota bacterium]
MAGGRDLAPRSPRWLNGLIWSSGVGAALFFTWKMLFCEAEPSCLPIAWSAVLGRLLAIAMLPLLLAITMVTRAVRWALE